MKPIKTVGRNVPGPKPSVRAPRGHPAYTYGEGATDTYIYMRSYKYLNVLHIFQPSFAQI